MKEKRQFFFECVVFSQWDDCLNEVFFFYLLHVKACIDYKIRDVL